MAKKTISGARAKKGQRSNGCNPRHNNRDYLPSNADPDRQHLNIFFCESTKSVTIEQIYDKLFQASYEEWLKKEHDKGRQKDAPEKYLDKVRTAKDKKRDQYEIIWQFGDRNNTGWKTNREDFMKARQLLADFADYLLAQPNITVVTPERMADVNWQPPFDDGLIITNLALHADESTPQMHMDFIPYSRSKTRGQSIQNAYAAAFAGMGYKVEEVHLTDPDTGELQYKKDKDGNFLLDPKGHQVPIMVKTSFGSIDWIEEQKGWLQHEMDVRYGWEREYKGKNPFGDVTISEFIAEDNLRQAAAAEEDAVFHHRLADAEAQRAAKEHAKAEEAWQRAQEANSQLAASQAELEELCQIKTMAERDQIASEAMAQIDELHSVFDVVDAFCADAKHDREYGGFNIQNLLDDFIFKWQRARERVISLVNSIKEKIRNISIFELLKKVRPEEQVAPVLQESLADTLSGAASRAGTAGISDLQPDIEPNR